MSTLSRRNFALGAVAVGGLAACSNGIGGAGQQTIDARVQRTLSYMYSTYPGTQDLAEKSAGILVMPVMTEAGFGIGGSYGRGVLQISGTTVDYYSATSASAGLQFGAQQFSHVLFFMTNEALMNFRQSSGWAAGADIEYALNDNADGIRADTTTTRAPVIAVVFAQAGIRIGASLEGIKYTRIIP